MKFKTSSLFPRVFNKVFRAVLKNKFVFYVLRGGRGSCKSSFISIVIIILIVTHKDLNAVILRKHENTLRESVYEQIIWAINMIGLQHRFKCTVSPMCITYIKTGQRILFRGVDKPVKIKSLKVSRGYIGIAWYEESTEFTPEETRSVNQSIIRGGQKFWVFESFNPPISRRNWKNTDVQTKKENRLIHTSDYRTVPVDWLGDVFISEAEYLKETNERLYKNEYLGEATGTGTNVFENIEVRKITDKEIEAFDFIYRGIDWGYFPDPFAYGEMSYNAKTKTLYIFREIYRLKSSNWATHEALLAAGCQQIDRITADSAEPKSVADLKEWGWNIKGAIKGKGSLEYGFKWLQSLKKIVIDGERCPKAAAEFLEYEYERDKDGNVLSGYPQGQDDHYMALTRYALEEVWKRRGV